MANDYDAVVVGSGPNGLAAAIALARAGLSVLVLEANANVGGGARSAELTLPGFIHDVCSAVHPMVLVSPFFRQPAFLGLRDALRQPEVPFAQPIDAGTAVAAFRSLDETAAGLGSDNDPVADTSALAGILVSSSSRHASRWSRSKGLAT